MSETGHDIQKLAAQIATGSITYDLITAEYGTGMTSSVMAFIAGGATGSVVSAVYDTAREVPIVGDVLDASASVIGDVAEGFLGIW